jgi:hypothetical protein
VSLPGRFEAAGIQISNSFRFFAVPMALAGTEHTFAVAPGSDRGWASHHEVSTVLVIPRRGRSGCDVGCCMENPARQAATAIWLVSSAAFGGLFALCMTPYQLKELLVCWLLFTLAFASLVLVILVGLTTYSAIENIVRSISAAAGGIPKVRLDAPTLHPK